MTDAALLEHIARLPHAKANFKQLVRELAVRGAGRAELEQTLVRLEERGDLVQVRAGHYIATAGSREYATGRVHVHRDGYGFLIPRHPVEGVEGDIFLPPDEARKAMHGDTAVVRISHIGPDGRAEGEILRVLKRAHPTVVGEFHITRRGMFVAPHDERIRQWIEIPEGMETPPAARPMDRLGARPVEISDPSDLDGMVVNVELLEFPERDEDAVGRVIEVLGRPDDFGIDVEIVIRKHHLPHRFPPEVVEQAESIPNVISAADLEGRRDFRDFDTVTIDGETARDFDDAVWVDRLSNGNFELHVHIADVSHYVRPGHPHRYGGAPARHQRLLPGPRRAHAAVRTLHQPLLAQSAGGPAGAVGVLEIDHSGDVVRQEFLPG